MIHVTITGADDAVSIADLAALYADFPFVEWGILLSPKHVGVPRYPGPDWVRRLDETSMRWAMHLCGGHTRHVLRGQFARPMLEAKPKRLQLNGFDRLYATGAFFDVVRELWPMPVILQARSVVDLEPTALVARTMLGGITTTHQSVLFDPSGGTGASPQAWPAAPIDVRLGYAGGIGPHNVSEVIESIWRANWRADGGVWPRGSWIDMESGVRTDNRFDIGKVREVLAIVGAASFELEAHT